MGTAGTAGTAAPSTPYADATLMLAQARGVTSGGGGDGAAEEGEEEDTLACRLADVRRAAAGEGSSDEAALLQFAEVWCSLSILNAPV
jgi:hypothetical protein